MIIKKCLLNFIHSMKYYLPTFAILCIGLFIGVASFINKTENNLNALAQIIDSKITSTDSFNISAFKNTILDEFKNLPWNNFWSVLKTLFSKSFLSNALKNALVSVIGETNYTEDLASSLDTTTSSLINGFISFACIFLFGLLVAYFYSKIKIKSELKMKVTLSKLLVVSIINYLLNISLVALVTYLLGLFPIGAFLTMIITLFINQGIALFEAYLSRSQKSITFKQIFTFKNISYLVLGTLLITLILSIISAIIVTLTNQTIGIILIIPLYFILISVISLNAYSFVKDYYKDKQGL